MIQRLADGQLQRVKVDGSFDENILQDYNNANAKTKALTPHKYDLNFHYDLTRAPTQASVVVKIRFVQPGGAAIPTSDTTTRTYINQMTAGIATTWAGKFDFVSTQHPAPTATPNPAGPTPSGSAGGPTLAPSITPAPAPGTAAPPAAVPVRLPVVFSAVPEFAPGDDGTMPVVQIHPQSEAANSNAPGKRIDAGNWFQNEGNYVPAGQSAADTQKQAVATASHEYGHLLGIPDEYSQSNANMHKLMHAASPTLSAGQDQQLDDAARRYMVLKAMSPALSKHAAAGATKATAAISKQKGNLERELRSAIVGVWTDAGSLGQLTTAITAQLTAGGHPALAAKVLPALRAEGTGLDTGSIAKASFAARVSLGKIRAMMQAALDAAIVKAQTVQIPITNASGQAGTMDISIETSRTVDKAAATGPLAGAAEKVAGATMDAGLGKGGVAPPALRPGGSFVSELQTLTGNWNTPGTLGTQASAMKGDVVEAYTKLGHDAAPVADQIQLNTFVRGAVASISGGISRKAVADLLTATFGPLMQGQVDAITAVVQTEIDAHRTATATGTNAAVAAAPDPRVAAAVNQVNAKMKQLQEAPGTAVPTEKRAGDANAPTTQHTAFSVQSMMGSGNAGGMRADYMEGILAKFNASFKKTDEDPFKTETK